MEFDSIEKLEDILRHSYSKETAYPGCRDEWLESDPTCGQCAITAMIVNEYFGGDIYRIKFPNGATHYYNIVNDEIVDLTREQFDLYGLDIPYDKGELVRSEYFGNNQDTKYRYMLLKSRMNEYYRCGRISNRMKLMYRNINDLENRVLECDKCPLSKTRHHVVFGEGPSNAKVMFIGEGPGYDEDRTGRPFVGKAGQLLDEVFNMFKIKREDVYIANVVKCRPPENRNPKEEEMEACLDYLRNQVMIIKPKIIVLLGSVALKRILGEDYYITKCRGQWIEKRGIRYLPTYHPAAVLRDDSKRVDFVEDIKIVSKEMKKL